MERNALENGTGPINIYQPGNGTRYEILCVETKPGLDLFIWVNAPTGGKITRLSRPSDLAAWWLSDRLNINDADCAALLAWLRDERGHTVWMPEGYGLDGRWGSEGVTA